MSNNNVAFVFPGQGSQKIGMLTSAHEAFQSVRDAFSEASDVLGYDMWELICNGDQADLNLTETTQPVLLTSSVALWRAWLESGGQQPSVMAGHSLGEFSALVCAGAIEFGDAVELVRKRGAFMQSAVPVGEGAMAAIIGLDDEAINRICADVASETSSVVSAVNYNSPGQVVIAGHTAAVEAANVKLKEAGAKRAMPLPVSAPFHTELMKPAGVKLEEVMAELAFSAPTIPVIHNVNGLPESDPSTIRKLLGEQIHSPVRWVNCVEAMVKLGAMRVVECGPGKVLSGLNRRIDDSLQSFSIEDPDRLQQTLSEMSI
ncbi:MAG: ACP S-malonyltransferase [Halioglobus sp.]